MKKRILALLLAFVLCFGVPCFAEDTIENDPYADLTEAEKEELNNLKKWEVSTVIANKIEAIITKPEGVIPQNRINSVGYGEFLPAKNTPNNGGNYLNRIDIIILCNISGE